MAEGEHAPRDHAIRGRVEYIKMAREAIELYDQKTGLRADLSTVNGLLETILRLEEGVLGEETGDDLTFRCAQEMLNAFLHLMRDLGRDPVEQAMMALKWFLTQELEAAAQLDLAEAELLDRPVSEQVPWRKGTLVILLRQDESTDVDDQYFWLAEGEEGAAALLPGFRPHWGAPG
jgi:hypothetical protein